MAGLVILLGFWGLVWTGIAMLGKGLALLVVLLIAWAPMALLLWWRSAKAAKGASRHAAILAESGIPAGQGLDHCEDGTGIAIDRPFGRLVLIGPEGHKSYPYAEVREWSAREERPGFVPNMGSAQAIGMAARAEMDAKKATGLFVKVADIERPLWRVAMKDASTRARWMEILQQAINEGGVRQPGLAAAGASA